jgi:hypothetical protein
MYANLSNWFNIKCANDKESYKETFQANVGKSIEEFVASLIEKNNEYGNGVLQTLLEEHKQFEQMSEISMVSFEKIPFISQCLDFFFQKEKEEESAEGEEGEEGEEVTFKGTNKNIVVAKKQVSKTSKKKKESALKEKKSEEGQEDESESTKNRDKEVCLNVVYFIHTPVTYLI